MSRLYRGDVDALAGVFHKHLPRLRQIIQLRLNPLLAARVDSSDVLQETYVDAMRRVARYVENPQVSPFVWLRGLAMDRLNKLDRFHRRTIGRSVARQMRLPSDDSAVLVARLLAAGPSPSQSVMSKELRDRIQGAIGRLRETDREIILMRHFEGMSNSEVAEALRIKESTAAMRHGRALHRLRELMNDTGRDEMSR